MSSSSTHNDSSTSFDDDVEDQDGCSVCTMLALAGVAFAGVVTVIVVIACCVCGQDDSPDELKSTCKAYAGLDQTRKCPASKPQLLENVKCLLQEVDESSPDKGLKQCADFENVCCEKATDTASEATSEPVDTTACPAAIQPPAQWAATLAPEGSLEGSIQRSELYPVMLDSIQEAMQDKVGLLHGAVQQSPFSLMLWKSRTMSHRLRKGCCMAQSSKVRFH